MPRELSPSLGAHAPNSLAPFLKTGKTTFIRELFCCVRTCLELIPSFSHEDSLQSLNDTKKSSSQSFSNLRIAPIMGESCYSKLQTDTSDLFRMGIGMQTFHSDTTTVARIHTLTYRTSSQSSAILPTTCSLSSFPLRLSPSSRSSDFSRHTHLRERIRKKSVWELLLCSR